MVDIRTYLIITLLDMNLKSVVPPVSITFTSPSVADLIPPSPDSCSKLSDFYSLDCYSDDNLSQTSSTCFPTHCPSISMLSSNLAVDHASPAFPFSSFCGDNADFDDTSHTDENDLQEAERRSGSGLDVADFAMVGQRKRRQDSHNSDTDSDADDLRSLDDFPVETNYVVQQEEEFGSVVIFYISNCYV